MKNSLFTYNFNFRKTFRHFRGRMELTFQQFFFLWYLQEYKLTDNFRTCDILLPGCNVQNTYYYLKILCYRGYLKKTEKHYSFTEKAKSNFRDFMESYNKSCSSQLSWA